MIIHTSPRLVNLLAKLSSDSRRIVKYDEQTHLLNVNNLCGILIFPAM